MNLHAMVRERPTVIVIDLDEEEEDDPDAPPPMPTCPRCNDQRFYRTVQGNAEWSDTLVIRNEDRVEAYREMNEENADTYDPWYCRNGHTLSIDMQNRLSDLYDDYS